MTTYVEDDSGEPVCGDCAVGACITPSGYQCEAEHCRCACRELDDPTTELGAAHRARELDNRPQAAMQNLADDIAREARPDWAELTRERFGNPSWGRA